MESDAASALGEIAALVKVSVLRMALLLLLVRALALALARVRSRGSLKSGSHTVRALAG